MVLEKEKAAGLAADDLKGISMSEYSGARSAIQSLTSTSLADLLCDDAPKRSSDLGWLLETQPASVFSNLANRPLWTAWREEERGGSKTKVPYRSTFAKSSADDRASWITREAAGGIAAKLESIGRKGVGIFLGGTGSVSMAGIDLDSCYDAGTQTIEPWAQEVIDRFGSYAEISPSGTGVKVFFDYATADLEELRAAMATQWSKSWSRGSHVEIALHLGGRYFAVTDQHCRNTPHEVRPVALETLLWLIGDAGPRFKANPTSKANDESRSGRAIQLAGKCKRAGLTLDHYRAELEKDPALAQWAKDARQVQRAWDRCNAGLLVDESDFDDLPSHSGWHVSAFPADELPDLSHDQLAIELGRIGWDNDARYVAQLGGWHLWKGHRWEPSPGMEPTAIVRSYVKAKASAYLRWAEVKAAALQVEGKGAEADKLLSQARGQAKALRQEPSIMSVERLARSNRRSLAIPEQWDCNDFLLGTPGGTVDLQTGELRPSDRLEYITKTTTTAPAPSGTIPNAWLQFLSEIFPDDPEMPGFMQRLAGYALTGSTREHRLFLFHGTGRNGKGTLLGTLEDIMGDYAKGIPTNTLLESRNPQHSSPLARLRGARLVRGAELPVGQVWNESLVKQMTGGDVITANMMRQDSFEFRPKFTLIVDANTKPRIRTTDPAMRARMTLVPFIASFMGREDKGLRDRLKTEAGAILRWMIEGAVAWQRDGLRIPAAVDQASREYLDAEDTLSDFIADELEGDAGGNVTVAAVYQRYTSWAEEQGCKPMTRRSLSDGMVERGLDRRKGAKNVSKFYGVKLSDVFDDGIQPTSDASPDSEVPE